MKKSELVTLIKQIVNDISKEKEILKDEEEPLQEMSASGDAGAYNTPNAFSKTGNIDKKKYEKNGMTSWPESDKWFVNQDKLSKWEKKARKTSPVNEDVNRFLTYNDHPAGDPSQAAEKIISLTDKYVKAVQKALKIAGPFLSPSMKQELLRDLKKKFETLK